MKALINKVKAAFAKKPNELANSASLAMIYVGLTANLVLFYKTGSGQEFLLGAAFITAMVAAYSVKELIGLLRG